MNKVQTKPTLDSEAFKLKINIVTSAKGQTRV